MTLKSNLPDSQLSTEKQNPNSKNLDQLNIWKILNTINEEDQKIAGVVKQAIPEIEKVVNLTISALKNGNRIYYVGAGTSGRLGILDAAEIPPTFSAPSDWFQGIIAGGHEAVFRSIEGAEDKTENVSIDLKNAGIARGDVLIGIASSSTTPYVTTALEIAHSEGLKTAFIICNPIMKINKNIDVAIELVTGSEVLTGSTRMKAGTATKMVLNMISTATMVKMGKVYGNLMVDLKVVNEKLLRRGIRIVTQLTRIDNKSAEKLLKNAGNSVKTAVVMHNKKFDRNEAEKILKENNGKLRAVVDDIFVELKE
ncbi:N-acetylmuramic acid 6-phosphate etherase [Candidatus Neomarinimicrobiota bacterium]